MKISGQDLDVPGTCPRGRKKRRALWDGAVALPVQQSDKRNLKRGSIRARLVVKQLLRDPRLADVALILRQ